MSMHVMLRGRMRAAIARLRLQCVLLLAIALLLPLPAAGVELNLSGFGTVGYARSDREFSYLRYIDDRGTIKTDSLVGVQAEAQFNPQWRLTVQGVASAPRTRDDGHEAKIRWAFASYRPDNEWLLRAGRVRPPVFIHTQNAEVGATYDYARLPVEVYSTSPVYDFDGAAVTRTWSTANGETSLDAYWGKSDVKLRIYLRDAAQPLYFPTEVTAKGLVVSHTTEQLLLRAGVHHASGEFKSIRPFEVNLPTEPFAPAPAPLGGTLYVPSNPLSDVDLTLVSFGLESRFSDWRVTAEYSQRIVNDTKIGLASKGGYATLARSIGRWTPYATYARLLSDSDPRQQFEAVNTAPVPQLAQGAPLFLPPNYHRILADQVFVFDQYSTMLGTSYSFSATSKLKLEWMRTHVGLKSSLVDGDVSSKSFNVLSVSYSVAF
jgi:hypothetical protein